MPKGVLPAKSFGETLPPECVHDEIDEDAPEKPAPARA